jgi:hypothetical protein
MLLMSKKMLLIKNNIVTNVISIGNSDYKVPEGHILLDMPENSLVWIGWSLDSEGNWKKPEIEEDENLNVEEDIIE